GGVCRGVGAAQRLGTGSSAAAGEVLAAAPGAAWGDADRRAVRRGKTGRGGDGAGACIRSLGGATGRVLASGNRGVSPLLPGCKSFICLYLRAASNCKSFILSGLQ